MPSPWTKSSISANRSKGAAHPNRLRCRRTPPHDFVIATGAPYSGWQFVIQFVQFAAVSPGAPMYFAGEDRERVNSCLARVTLVVIPAQARTCLVYQLVLAGMAVWKRVITARYLGNYQVALVLSASG